MYNDDSGHLVDGTKDREATLLSTNRVLAVAAVAGMLASALFSNKLLNPSMPWAVIGATLVATGLLWQFKLTTEGDKERMAYMAVTQIMVILAALIGVSWWTLAPLALGTASYFATVFSGRVRHDRLWMRFLMAFPIVPSVLASLYLITIGKMSRAGLAKPA